MISQNYSWSRFLKKHEKLTEVKKKNNSVKNIIEWWVNWKQWDNFLKLLALPKSFRIYTTLKPLVLNVPLPATLFSLGHNTSIKYYHLGGFSHNVLLLKEGVLEANRRTWIQIQNLARKKITFINDSHLELTALNWSIWPINLSLYTTWNRAS